MAESNDSEDVINKQTDDDLDNLLDSALGDFTEISKDKPVVKKDETKESKETNVDDMWSEMIKQALQADPNFQEMFQQGSDEENNFVQDFSKIAEAAAKVIEGDCPNNIADIMSETLKNLNESSETIQNQFGNPQELAGLFQEMGLDGNPSPDDSLDDFPPFMQNIMQSFLSKDVLYPSMQEFVSKYPAWLDEHKQSLSPEQYENYCMQKELMTKVIEEFEAESETDSEVVKKQRFHRIMDLMQQMQSLGQPPADLIGGDGTAESAMPALPLGMDPNQCSIM